MGRAACHACFEKTTPTSFGESVRRYTYDAPCDRHRQNGVNA